MSITYLIHNFKENAANDSRRYALNLDLGSTNCVDVFNLNLWTIKEIRNMDYQRTETHQFNISLSGSGFEGFKGL